MPLDVAGMAFLIMFGCGPMRLCGEFVLFGGSAVCFVHE